MREWLESLSDEAREALGGELLEALRRSGALLSAVKTEEMLSARLRNISDAAEMDGISLHNTTWRESASAAAVGERAFLAAFVPGTEAFESRTEENSLREDVLEELSRRLEREDRRYDNGFPDNA